MTRARQTAFVIAEDFPELEVQLTRDLRECTPTTWREDIMAEVTPNEAAECEAQLERAFAEYFVPSPEGDRHDILVCHGNVTRYLVTRALGVDPASWLGMSVAHCSITTIRIAPDGALKVLGVGDIGHVPPNLRSGLFSDARELTVSGP
jgi:serine/threonine-protein phosphatase PGAM5